jgi:hypothetical protein
MPVHLKALLVIVALAMAVFVLSKSFACSSATTPADFDRRRNLWFAVIIAAFLAHNYYIFAAIASVLLIGAAKSDSNRFAMYFLMLFAVPMYEKMISGLGIANHLFMLDYSRLLALVVLFPAMKMVIDGNDYLSFGRTSSDKFIAGYLLLNLGLTLSVNTITNSFRLGVFYPFLDVFLPYFVASRTVRNLSAFKDVLMAFAVASLILSAIAAFEYARHWLLYQNLSQALGANIFGGYLMRGDDTLRAQASTGQPIVLGYIIAIAMAFMWFLRATAGSVGGWRVAALVLAVGLYVPVSRGPWVGAVVIILILVATGPEPFKRLMVLGTICSAAFAGLLATPMGDKVLALLPFVGTVDAENVTFRQDLLNMSLEVILQNPFFGAYDYARAEQFEELRQGNGFLDIVNTYLSVAMGSGLVGLVLFSGVFLSATWSVLRAMNRLIDRTSEIFLLGQTLLAAILGTMVIIFTVSSVSYIPIVYWSLVGLCLAYARIVDVSASASQATNQTRKPPFLSNLHGPASA